MVQFITFFLFCRSGVCGFLPCLWVSEIWSLRKTPFDCVLLCSDNYMQRELDFLSEVAIKKFPQDSRSYRQTHLHACTCERTHIHTHTHRGRHFGDFYIPRKTSDKLREGLSNTQDSLLSPIHFENSVERKIRRNV